MPYQLPFCYFALYDNLNIHYVVIEICEQSYFSLLPFQVVYVYVYLELSFIFLLLKPNETYRCLTVNLGPLIENVLGFFYFSL